MGVRGTDARVESVARAWLLVAAFLVFVSVPALAQPLSVDMIPRPQRVQAGDGGAVRLRDCAPIVVGAHDASAMTTARWPSALSLRSRRLRPAPTSPAPHARP